MVEMFSDEYFMREALKEAQIAYEIDEVPVGCVVVWRNKIIGKAHNLTESLNDPTAHAEMQAITAATDYIGGKYLEDCTLYVTLEPCVMCAGACFWARPSRVVYGADDLKRGFASVYKQDLHPKTIISKGILADEAAELLSSFFKRKRSK